MSELLDKLRPEFKDEEYRHAYADECLDTMIATQIKVLREQRKMTQGQLAVATGMKQPRIPLLEDATYSNWTINTLKRFAKAFDLALSVKFESFSRFIGDFESLSRLSLQRPSFASDVQFQNPRPTFRRLDRRHSRARRYLRNRKVLPATGVSQPQVSGMGLARKPPRSAQAFEGTQRAQGADQATAVGQAAAAGGRL